jgi:RNA polymerase sigma-70 factor (ECF subfamily)
MGTAAIAIETRAKDERFEEVALEHMNSVYRLALSMSKNENNAQDLVQDTYLKAYRFFDKFGEGTNCQAWLFTILKNTFINAIHREKTQPHTVSLSEMKGDEMELSSDTNTEDSVFGDLFDDDVAAAMDRLPDEFKTTVLLADVEGLTYREIADIMNCPIGTVMSRLHRGREFLKKRLWDYADQHGYI